MNPKSKGNSFEREICKKLSLWLSNNKMDDVFWRTSNSGGRYTSRKKVGKTTENQIGDIGLNSDFEPGKKFLEKFVVECKFYKSLDFWGLILENKSSDVFNFWCKLLVESDNVEKHPLLIYKTNNRPILVLTSSYISDKFVKYFNLKPKLIIKLKPTSLDSIDNNDKDDINVYFFEDVIKLNTELFTVLIEEIF